MFEFYDEVEAQKVRDALYESAAYVTDSGRLNAIRTDAPSVPRIVSCCAKACGVSSAEPYARSRTKNATLARHLSWYLLLSIRGFAYADIGKEFQRDHSSVMHGVKRIATQLTTDSWVVGAMRKAVDALTEGVDCG